jgi:hypothetical protein
MRDVEDREFFIECAEGLGFITEVDGDDLICYWGTPEKKKRSEEEKRPERRSKTERRLGKKYYSSE